jgi:NAD(P)-dependent dehydrogenase (short-subunit alcohol dehydrogenase family)
MARSSDADVSLLLLGASRGLGLATMTAALEMGTHVLGVARNLPASHDHLRNRFGSRYYFARHDLSSRPDIEDLSSHIAATPQPFNCWLFIWAAFDPPEYIERRCEEDL